MGRETSPQHGLGPITGFSYDQLNQSQRETASSLELTFSKTTAVGLDLQKCCEKEMSNQLKQLN